MIFESYPWKQDLEQRKQQFLEYNTAEHFQEDEEATYMVLEKAVFYAAFIIRKLLDCKTKLSDAADQYTLPVEQYVLVKKMSALHNWPDENSHNWDTPKRRKIQGRKICDWLIHSFSFSFVFDEQQMVTGFFVTSDKTKDLFLYYVSIKDWLAYMEFIATDTIVELHYHKEPESNEYEVMRKKREVIKKARTRPKRGQMGEEA